MGKMMEQGPVLIITFQAQLVMVIKNPKGEVVEGDPVSAGWPLCGCAPLHPFLPIWGPHHRSPPWLPAGQGATHAVRVGAVPRPGRAQPLRCLAPPGHLCVQHRASPLSAAGIPSTRAGSPQPTRGWSPPGTDVAWLRKAMAEPADLARGEGAGPRPSVSLWSGGPLLQS